MNLFQFTRPAWGATPFPWFLLQEYDVSIHAPRVGRDQVIGELRLAGVRFNSRAPRGARPWSTVSPGVPFVSIHAPRVGRDSTPQYVLPPPGFQFTRPAWGATNP